MVYKPASLGVLHVMESTACTAPCISSQMTCQRDGGWVTVEVEESRGVVEWQEEVRCVEVAIVHASACIIDAWNKVSVS